MPMGRRWRTSKGKRKEGWRGKGGGLKKARKEGKGKDGGRMGKGIEQGRKEGCRGKGNVEGEGKE